jgi:poly-gamma-glutamate synthesis protein (capsule biosynthesis protein)
MNRIANRLPPAALLLPALFVVGPNVGLAQDITLVAAGDVEWSRVTKPPQVAFDSEQRWREDGWMRVPYILTDESRPFLEDKLGKKFETPRSHHIISIHYGLEFDSPEDMARYPFRNIAPVLREADVAFANLETPLSDRARYSGAFRVSPAFADGLRWAGIDVVSTANNHALDAEGQGLLDTREALFQAGVGAVGTGRNLDEARRPFIIERDGIKIAFFGYAHYVLVGGSAFALPDRAGVVPLDPFIIREDIRRIRDEVDYVAVSFHWGIENSQDTHPAARAFAHDVIDAGADLILGHHPHVPRGIEVYKGKVIVYSFGNLIFGHNHTYWMDNYVTRMTLTPEEIAKVEILPVAGRGNHLSQPYVLAGEEARALLEDVQARSAQLDTRMDIEGDVGTIVPRTAVLRAGQQ